MSVCGWLFGGDLAWSDYPRRIADAAASKDSAAALDATASGDTATGGCKNACPGPGAKSCAPSGLVQTCVADGAGCLNWDKGETCPAGTACMAGTCAKASCSPNCSNKPCGESDGCGGSCGCPGGLACVVGKCQLPCKDADNFCEGSTLNYCGPTGGMDKLPCTDAACQAVGFLGFQKCGSNPGDAPSCLCTPCTADNNGCKAGSSVVCDLKTGKISETKCPAGQVCSAGVCQGPCTDNCSKPACVAGKFVGCELQANGCKLKQNPVDCDFGQLCKPGASGCSDCESSLECPANEVCVPLLGCTEASGGDYKVTIESAVFPQYDAGSAWDGGGGLPDPKVCVSVSGKAVGCTTEKSDTLTPVWSGQSFVVTLYSYSKLEIAAYDIDVMSDDYADGSAWSGWLSLVKAGGYNDYLYNDVVKVKFSIVPVF